MYLNKNKIMMIDKYKKKKRWAITTLLVIVILLALIAVLSTFKNTDKPTSTPQANSGSSMSTPPTTLKPSEDSSTVIIEQPADGKTLAPGNTNSTSENITPQIIRAEQSGSEISISVIFPKQVNGQCRLSLSKNGFKTYEQTVSVIVGATYYTCNGFRFAANILPADGEWSSNVTLITGTGTETTSDIKIINIQR